MILGQLVVRAFRLEPPKLITYILLAKQPAMTQLMVAWFQGSQGSQCHISAALIPNLLHQATHLRC